MLNKQNVCLTIQDFSCMGRCSLTEAIPVLSSAGIETVAIPTAVLSNHTSGFTSWTYNDLTADIIPIADKWTQYERHFDAIYTGYLGDNQIDVVLRVINLLKSDDTTIVIDPAFADNGSLYPSFTFNHVTNMKKLIEKADIILPNLTEACFLLNKELKDTIEKEYIKALLMGLSSLGPDFVVISGIKLNNQKVGCFSYNKKKEQFFSYYGDDIGDFHGAGDLFASSFVSSFLNDNSLTNSIKIAHDFVHKAMLITKKYGMLDKHYGLEFERAIPYLLKRLKK